MSGDAIRDGIARQSLAALDRLDGTTTSAVSLLTGMSPAEISDLGGIGQGALPGGGGPPAPLRPVVYLPPHPDDETLLYAPDHGRVVSTARKSGGEGVLRRRYVLRRRLALAACRVGLHFLTWHGQCDAYTCACWRIMLRAEEIR